MTDTHKHLQDVAILWLYGVGCNVFAKEVPTQNGIADALGIRSGKEDVYYLECKASRPDLICKKQKQIYETAIGGKDAWCWQHDPDMYPSMFKNVGVDRTIGWQDCQPCQVAKMRSGDTGIDFYYIVAAEGLKVEDALYPMFGVINHKGEIVRRAKRMKRLTQERTKDALIAAAHVLVYKAYGKLYIGESISTA